jgi:hypothetical protein
MWSREIGLPPQKMQRRGGLGMRLGFLLVVVGALVMIRRQLSRELRAPRWDEMNYSD